MGKFKITVLIGSLFFFFSCAKDGRSEAVKAKNLPAPTDSNGSPSECFAESTLLTQGIVGGTRVAPTSKDSKNAIMIYSGDQLCTATAISPRVLLTAAHCLTGPADQTVAFVGTSLSCGSGFNSLRDRLLVSGYVVHEKYHEDANSQEFSVNDIALVFLAEDLSPSYPIFKITNPAAVADTGPLYFWGFGDIRNGTSAGAGILRKTEVSENDYEVLLERKKVLVRQNKGHGICHGDSGGPAFVTVDGHLEILGVNSFIEGANEAEACNGISYLTLANSFRPWLAEKMKLQNESLKD